jgi:hypothetical protein
MSTPSNGPTDFPSATVIGIVFTLLMFVRMFFYTGDEPVFGMTAFLGLMITAVIAMFAASIGLGVRTDLAKLRDRADVDAAKFARILPTKYAVIGALAGLALAGQAWYGLKSDPAYAFQLWIVIAVAACTGLIGLLLGMSVRSGLNKRLAVPSPSFAPPPMPTK